MSADRSGQSDENAVIDKHGDVWRLGADGLMHTPETTPFPREYVERKWGPLRPVADLGRPQIALVHLNRQAPPEQHALYQDTDPDGDYYDASRPGRPSCCPGAGSMAHVRGCQNHPEADRG